MNAPEMRRLKMNWLAAREAGDAQAQKKLLHENPEAQDELIDFIAAYHATGGDEQVEQNVPLLAVTQRAYQSALERVFTPQVAVSTLQELRKSQSMSKVDVAQGLRLSVDVWNKFESGAIELMSLSQRQVGRLAQFFQISVEQFSSLLDNSQPAISLNRRQSSDAARSADQGPHKQSFTDAIARSTMSREDIAFWQED